MTQLKNVIALTQRHYAFDYKLGDILQVDCIDGTVSVIDTDTSEDIPAYVFVCYIAVQWIRLCKNILIGGSGVLYCCTYQCPQIFRRCYINLTMLQSRMMSSATSKVRVTLNKFYNNLAERYGTTISSCRVRSPNDKIMVEGTVVIVSNLILSA